MDDVWKLIDKIVDLVTAMAVGRGCGRFSLGVIGLGITALSSGPWWAPIALAAFQTYGKLDGIPAYITPLWVTLIVGFGLIAAGFYVFYNCPIKNAPQAPPLDPDGVRFRIGSNIRFQPFAERLCRQHGLELELRHVYPNERMAMLQETQERHHDSLENALLELRQFAGAGVIRPYTVRQEIKTMMLEFAP